MKRSLLLLGLLLLVGVLQAQDKYFYINYDVNKPLTNTNWIGDVSTRGVRAGYRVFITPKISAGLDLGWSVFDQYQPTQTFENTSGAVTTDYFKYVYTYSAAVSGQYNFPAGDDDRFYPYVGLGLGANYNQYQLYYNIYQQSDSQWGFLARPEAGILVRIGRSIGAMAAVHYDYSTNKSEDFKYSNFSSLGFQIGLTFMDF